MVGPTVGFSGVFVRSVNYSHSKIVILVCPLTVRTVLCQIFLFWRQRCVQKVSWHFFSTTKKTNHHHDCHSYFRIALRWSWFWALTQSTNPSLFLFLCWWLCLYCWQESSCNSPVNFIKSSAMVGSFEPFCSQFFFCGSISFAVSCSSLFLVPLDIVDCCWAFAYPTFMVGFAIASIFHSVAFSLSTSFLVGSLQDFLPRKRWKLFRRLVGERIQRTCLFSSGFSLFFLGSLILLTCVCCRILTVGATRFWWPLLLKSYTVLRCFSIFKIWIFALF